MGKIIRNGIEFSGACEDATAVNYNNSLSGLEAQTVQEAIDELSTCGGGDIEATLLATVTTTSTSNIQELSDDINNYKFLLIIRSNSSTSVANMSGLYPVDFFKSSNKVVAEYYSPSANSNRGVHVFYQTDTTVKAYVTQDTEIGYIYGIKSIGGSGNGSSESLENKVGFIDTDNVIENVILGGNSTAVTTGTCYTYTATQNCYLSAFGIVNSNYTTKPQTVNLNDTVLFSSGDIGLTTTNTFVPINIYLKKDDVVTFNCRNISSLIVYGIK